MKFFIAFLIIFYFFHRPPHEFIRILGIFLQLCFKNYPSLLAAMSFTLAEIKKHIPEFTVSY